MVASSAGCLLPEVHHDQPLLTARRRRAFEGHPRPCPETSLCATGRGIISLDKRGRRHPRTRQGHEFLLRHCAEQQNISPATSRNRFGERAAGRIAPPQACVLVLEDTYHRRFWPRHVMPPAPASSQ